MSKSNTPLEHDEQSSFVQEVHVRYDNRPDFIKELFFSVPNGMWAGGRNKFALVNKFKSEGMNPGVFDIHYLQPRGTHPFLCIEFKRRDRRGEKDGGLTSDQKLYMQACELVGAYFRVCYTAEEAVEAFSYYMELEQ